MKKFRLTFLLLLIFMPCVLFFSGCGQASQVATYVVGIEYSGTIDGVTTYTVKYSDGTTSLMTLKQGQDGENGQDLTIESIMAYCEATGEDFDTFIKKFLTVEYNPNEKTQAVAKAMQSAVSVWSEFNVDYGYTKDTDVGCGAGVIYQMNDDYSYIITNYHVVYYDDSTKGVASNVHIFQYGTQEVAGKNGKKDAYGYPIIQYGEGAVKCEYVGGSMAYDIAILKAPTQSLKEVNENACAVTLANGYTVGDTTIAIGNPECEGISATSGIISVESEEITMRGADDKTIVDYRVIRTDSAVNGGNSGGGLFNAKGELIGIVNAKIVDAEIDNMAYALPVDNVSKVADNIIYYHEKTNDVAVVKKLYLDISYYVENYRQVYNPETGKSVLKDDLVVHEVSPKSAVSSFLTKGDIIKSIKILRTDGSEESHDIVRSFQLTDLFLTVRAGDQLLFSGERENLVQYFGTITITEDMLVNPDILL